MKPLRFAEMTTDQLVQRFVTIALHQDEAISMEEFSRYNKLFDEMDAIKEQLKRRHNDERRALLPLYRHPNVQVRLKAAIATLALAPESARQQLLAIARSEHYPQAADAKLIVTDLDRGAFTPS